MAANGNSPTVSTWALTDEEIVSIRRIEPHTGSPLWVIINCGEYISAPVRAWAWTDGVPTPNGRIEVYFGPLALHNGEWHRATGDGPEGTWVEVFDTKAEADNIIATLLT